MNSSTAQIDIDPAEPNDLEKPKPTPKTKPKDGRSKQRTPAQIAATQKMLKAKENIRNAKRKETEDKKQAIINDAVQKEMLKQKRQPQEKQTKLQEEPSLPSSDESSSDDDHAKVAQVAVVRRKKTNKKKKQPIVQYHNYYYGNNHNESKPTKSKSPKQTQRIKPEEKKEQPFSQPKKDKPTIKFV